MPNENANDLNSILFKYNPTGASAQTGKQDGLTQKGIFGAKASQKMAEADSKRVLKHSEKFIAAAKQFKVPPALLAAIASRESRGGAVLKNGFGDHGNGFGLMQVDKRHHTVEGLNDPFGLEHIMQATGILRGFFDAVAKKHPDWASERQLQGATAAYNSGVGNIQTLNGMDAGTTGNDYSNDVWARAQFYAQEMGSQQSVAATPTIAMLTHLDSMTVPAPTMAEVEAGTSMLQRKQKGAAVLTLQEALQRLNYLILNEEQKTGLSIFGPMTETALQAFQRDAYLPATGVYEILTHSAMRQLLDESIKKDPDNHTGLVRRLQDRLVELGHLNKGDVGSGYGTFGPKTEAALKEFQGSKQIAPANGVLTVATYLAIRAAAPAPPSVVDISSSDDKKIESQLPNQGPGFFAKGGSTRRETQFSTERTLNRLMAFAAVWMQTHPDRPLRIGEMSVKGGGLFGAHKGQGHARGVGVDIGLFRKDGQNLGTSFRAAEYDRKLVQELVTALDQSPNVFLIVFNDPAVKASAKLRHDKAGVHVHDNHLHVEFGKR
jgi:peptidoglycan hydrolase-like protein with peptidoglycan-binding domain